MLNLSFVDEIITLLQDGFPLFCSLVLIIILPKWPYSVWNRHFQHHLFWRSKIAFQRPIAVFSLQLCSSVSCNTVAISVHTAPLCWQECWLSDRNCPAASERFMALVRPFTFKVSCVISCVCISLQTYLSVCVWPQGSIQAVVIPEFACGFVQLSHCLWLSNSHRTLCVLLNCTKVSTIVYLYLFNNSVLSSSASS